MEEEKGGNQRLESFMVVDFEKNGPTWSESRETQIGERQPAIEVTFNLKAKSADMDLVNWIGWLKCHVSTLCTIDSAII